MRTATLVSTIATIAPVTVQGEVNYTVRLATVDGRKYESVVSFASKADALAFAIDQATDAPETSAAWERMLSFAATITVVWPDATETRARSYR